MNVSYHVKYLKSLIKGAPKKKGSKKEPPTVTPGSWNTGSNGDSSFYVVGVDTDGVYRITWRSIEGVEIDKLQSMFNFSYIAALNPVALITVIEEFERLTEVEQELISLKERLNNTYFARLKKLFNKTVSKFK